MLLVNSAGVERGGIDPLPICGPAAVNSHFQDGEEKARGKLSRHLEVGAVARNLLSAQGLSKGATAEVQRHNSRQGRLDPARIRARK